MWNLTHATSQGLVYFHEGRNNQDAVSSWSDGSYCLGIINDGCHGGLASKNEVGALLSNRFLRRKGVDLLLSGVTPRELPAALFPEYGEYLHWQTELQFLDTPEELDDFIAHYLMCTTIGVVADRNELCIFWAGDGVIYLNNGVFRSMTSEGNMPRYPAYELYRRYGLANETIIGLIPDGFESEVLPVEMVKILGISSDGLLAFPHLFDELKAHSKTRMSLQMCLNRISTLRSETSDNVSVVFAEKKED